MTILAIAMQKGGVGKTTTTLSLGVELGRLGRRVLLVDMDAQSNLTQAVGIDPLTLTQTVYDLLLEPSREIGQVVLTTAYGVDLIPATLGLARAEMVLAGHVGRELLLRRALSGLVEAYDYILIDSPPSLGLLTLNALAAADAVLVPLQSHVFALNAMAHLEETIRLIQQFHPRLHIGGIVMTMVDRRTSVNMAVDQAARQEYGELVYQTVIPFHVKLVEAPAVGQPIQRYAPGSSSAVAYAQLTQEVIARHG
ncbi:ParA family protein [Candidatus Oscillochloris fontis]|uniref:ParA family protein n=1 Tax=Candidatus Oscillochloris fontis TaxID=2496868 RepID=UPI00101DA20D|nr:ParA family protein [Candidatus Oscillochloris fontis]